MTLACFHVSLAETRAVCIEVRCVPEAGIGSDADLPPEHWQPLLKCLSAWNPTPIDKRIIAKRSRLRNHCARGLSTYRSLLPCGLPPGHRSCRGRWDRPPEEIAVRQSIQGDVGLAIQLQIRIAGVVIRRPRPDSSIALKAEAASAWFIHRATPHNLGHRIRSPTPGEPCGETRVWSRDSSSAPLA